MEVEQCPRLFVYPLRRVPHYKYVNNTTRLATIDFLLSKVPPFECKPGCADCCGPIMMSRLELKRIVERTGIDPKRLETAWKLKHGCLTCPLVTSGNKCSVYDIRPAICKVFGSTTHPRLTCPHGLGPKEPLSAEETNTLIDQVMTLGHGCSSHLEKSACEFLLSIGQSPQWSPST